MVSNFYEDVNNSDNKKAEQIAFEAIENHFEGKPVVIKDCRTQNLKWDLEIRRDFQVERVDVKHDSYYEKSGRIPFEVYHQFSNGVIDPSWGVNAKLHTLAIVPWTFSKVVMIPLHHLRAYVTFCLSTIDRNDIEEERNWKRFARRNMGGSRTWTTYGWAIPQDGFEKYLNHFSLGEIITLPTNPDAHRTPPRLLIGGEEVA